MGYYCDHCKKLIPDIHADLWYLKRGKEISREDYLLNHLCVQCNAELQAWLMDSKKEIK